MPSEKKPRFVSAHTAVEAVRSNDDVVLANFCGEPHRLPTALMDRASELTGVRLFHFTVHGPFQERYLEPGMEKHVRCATAFCGRSKAVRECVRSGRADFYPVTFGKVPHLLREGDFRSDVLMITVSPPDAAGYCSLGVSVDYAWAALERPARVVIAEVNRNMPRTQGRSFVHLSRFDSLVEVDEPIWEMPQPPMTDVETKIGEHIASLVDDGSTLQTGYGALSEAVIRALKHKKDLGVHTEMVPDGMMDLVASGAVTNARKSLHRGKIVCTFQAGSRKLYQWLHENPLIEMQPVDYTNDPEVIARNSKMVAINTALQVDLFGNIYADMFGLNDQYTGSGGQPDFAVGCSLAPDAKFITVMPSTTNDGKFSRIVAHPTLEKGNAQASQMPTITRYYADCVVTEFGIAHLKEKSNSERAKALIQIANPAFRDTLKRQAKEMGLV
ncbi:MAG: acetyl-CoA hydrolase/transferase family protein [Chloroflexi bacterium]|nr:acetyl-CoA hydrolase/transferase family protein [Chloroflexota bacterium]